MTESKIHVLNIIPYRVLPPKFGGQKAIAFFNEYLGREINLTCISPSNNIADAPVSYELLPILSTGKFRYCNLLYFFKIRKIIREKGITHIMGEHPYYGWLLVLLQRFCRVKMVVRSHNIEALRFKSIGKWWWRMLYFYEKWTYRHADYLFLITEADRSFCIEHFKTATDKSFLITYGIPNTENPSPLAKMQARQWLQEKYRLKSATQILLFNGAFNYAPNANALQLIVQKIIPALAEAQLDFTVLICGKDIPQEITAAQNAHLQIAGFVEDIHPYFLGADIFLNPIVDGGGIKTKLVEALSFNTSVVSFESGAIGVPTAVTGNQLTIVPDHEVNQFVSAIMAQLNHKKEDLPTDFYRYFSWKNIAQKAAKYLSQ